MSIKVLITPRTFGSSSSGPADLMRELGYELVFNPYGRILTEEEMAEHIADADGIIVGLDPLNKEVLAKAKNLKVISKYGVGIDNIDLEAATERGIMVANAPGTNNVAVAELAVGLMLDVARRISLCDRMIRSGQWSKQQGFQLQGKTLGLIGTGLIGREVAKRAKGFDMEIICSDLYPDYEWAESIGASYMETGDVLRKADVISLHLPLVKNTYHMISTEQFAMMKETAILINTARGGLVDEAALLEALKNGVIAGAGFDVYEEEPPLNSPLRELDNMVLTAHIGAHTKEAATAMAYLSVENLRAGLSGSAPKFLCNPEVVEAGGGAQ
ncbi:MAG: phosphoglycerate dehydrogenase [Bacillota bacterium]|nr:phosphoglycerate dehydrogenase [Bacillota bacterium]